MLIPVHLSRVFIREMADMQIIELTETGGDRRFPIVIGLPEAFAIDRRMKGIQIPRPQTHDLLGSVIRALGARLKEVRITRVESGTFYAQLVIEQDGEELFIDSRPSDAIALGVADSVPLLVDESVLEEAAAEAPEGADGLPAIEPDDDEDDGDDDEGRA